MALGAILFDFDGTLVDARESVWQLFAETNERFGLGIDTREDFFAIFHGNFFDSLAALSHDQQQLEAANEHFSDLLRSRYRPRLIPGIADVVKSLAPTHTLIVLSSNSMAVIRRALVEAGVATCFSHVFSGDVEPSKTESIRRFLNDHNYAALRECSPSYVDSSHVKFVADNVFLVTDTVGDITEASRVGIRAVGVAWGMHDEDSLRAAGAERVALWPQELTAWFAEWVSHGMTCSCDSCSHEAGPCNVAGVADGDTEGACSASRIRDQRQTVRAETRRAAVSRCCAFPSAPRPSVAAGHSELRRAIAGTMTRP
jgi:phosphoglycolate phosphatase